MTCQQIYVPEEDYLAEEEYRQMHTSRVEEDHTEDVEPKLVEAA